MQSIICIDYESTENFVCVDDSFSVIEDFFIGQTERPAVTFYWQKSSHEYVNLEGNRLFITNCQQEALDGILISFLRSDRDSFEPIQVSSITQQIFTYVLDTSSQSPMVAISQSISKFLLPMLKSVEDWGELPRSKTDEFLNDLGKFKDVLVSAESSRKEKNVLIKTGKEKEIEQLKSPLECKKLAVNRELVVDMEGVIDIWFGQILKILQESEQMRRETHDAGPAAEIIHWKGQWSKFASLIEEIKTQRCQSVVRFLHVAKSRKVQQWRQIDSKVTVAVNEARDNVKYLQTLDNFVILLSRCSPEQMIEHLPGLMNSITMIYNVSQYYNTSERITSLFLKITNEMIRMCRNFILGDHYRIWEIDRPVLIERVQECMELNKKYQESFRKAKAKLHASSSSHQFDFSENYSKFQHFDDFR